jgi:hypothetical protein
LDSWWQVEGKAEPAQTKREFMGSQNPRKGQVLGVALRNEPEPRQLNTSSIPSLPGVCVLPQEMLLPSFHNFKYRQQ